jgi:hypothetical protein
MGYYIPGVKQLDDRFNLSAYIAKARRLALRLNEPVIIKIITFNRSGKRLSRDAYWVNQAGAWVDLGDTRTLQGV